MVSMGYADANPSYGGARFSEVLSVRIWVFIPENTLAFSEKEHIPVIPAHTGIQES